MGSDNIKLEDKLAACLAGRRIGLGNSDEYLNAAVALPLVRRDGVLSILFEVRSSALAWQPGDICFPGGRLEEGDATPLACALRETREELGVSEASLRALGPLDLVASSIGVLLHPFVVELSLREGLKLSREEVAEVFMAPLDYLLQTEPHAAQMQLFTRPLANFPFHFFPDGYPADYKKRGTYEVLFYPFGNHTIWGLTAKILSNFLNICRPITGVGSRSSGAGGKNGSPDNRCLTTDDRI